MEHKRILLNIVNENGISHLSVEFGHTVEEWKDKWYDYDLWDFPIEELLDGTIEPNQDIVYWCIDGRCYETEDYV